MPPFKPVDPKQSFPEMEQRVAARWKEDRIFERSMEQRDGAEVWSFYEGPPTANGQPGSHHVLSRVFKDIYPRYRSMRGYRVPRKAGWDCHGLPVELEVEKELGISSKQEIEEFGIAEFNQRCRESVFAYVEEWNRLTERLLDRPRRPLRHTRQRVHRVGLVVAQGTVGERPAVRGPPGLALLSPLRHGALLP
jgi:isoleucyl-tRNA synthetase